MTRASGPSGRSDFDRATSLPLSATLDDFVVVQRDVPTEPRRPRPPYWALLPTCALADLVATAATLASYRHSALLWLGLLRAVVVGLVGASPFVRQLWLPYAGACLAPFLASIYEANVIVQHHPHHARLAHTPHPTWPDLLVQVALSAIAWLLYVAVVGLARRPKIRRPRASTASTIAFPALDAAPDEASDSELDTDDLVDLPDPADAPDEPPTPPRWPSTPDRSVRHRPSFPARASYGTL